MPVKNTVWERLNIFGSLLTWKHVLDRNKLDCFIPGKPFHSSLMLEGQAWSLRLGSGLTHKHSTRLERLAGKSTLAFL
jgi:hypothetical protein